MQKIYTLEMPDNVLGFDEGATDITAVSDKIGQLKKKLIKHCVQQFIAKIEADMHVY